MRNKVFTKKKFSEGKTWYYFKERIYVKYNKCMKGREIEIVIIGSRN